jgi:hypothetical protein
MLLMESSICAKGSNQSTRSSAYLSRHGCEGIIQIKGNLLGMESCPSPLPLVQDLEVKLDRLPTEKLGKLEVLKTKYIRPALKFFSKGTSGISIFERLEALQKGIGSKT